MLKRTALFVTVLLIQGSFAYSGTFIDDDTLEVDWNLYHTTDEINNEIANWRCNAMAN